MRNPLVLVMLACVAVALSACVTSRDRVNAQWGKVWQDRVQSYKAARATNDKISEDAFKKVMSVTSENSYEAFSDYLKTSYNRAFTNGKLAMMEEYLKHRQTGPTPQMTAVWFEDRAGKLIRWGEDQEAQWKSHLAAGNTSPLPEGYIGERIKLVSEGALVNGAKDELVRTWREADGYHADLRVAAREDAAEGERMGMALMMFGQGMQQTAHQMQQTNFQQQMLWSANRPVTCQKVGTFVNCY